MSILHRRKKWRDRLRAKQSAGPLVCSHTRATLAAAAADEVAAAPAPAKATKRKAPAKRKAAKRCAR